MSTRATTPTAGGTHLPDVTVVMPVFAGQLDLPGSETEPVFYLAARGHHAEIGGSTPGSMPSDSRNVDEEGVILDAHLLVRDGAFRTEATRAVLVEAPMPSRAVGHQPGRPAGPGRRAVGRAWSS